MSAKSERGRKRGGRGRGGHDGGRDGDHYEKKPRKERKPLSFI